MKKTLIVMIILLIICIIVQNLYYHFRKNDDISPNIISETEDNQTEPQRVAESYYINGILQLYQDYSPKMDISTLQHKLYEFIFENIPQIYENVKDKDDNQIKEYYLSEKEKINLMDIYNEDEFYMISKQIKNIFYEDVLLEESRIDEVSLNENNIVKFHITLIYDNEKELNINVLMSKIIDSIEFSSATGLDKMFEKYTGKVSKVDVLKKIESFISNIKDYRMNSTLKTENERRQYFDLNKEELEKIGITSQDDYVNVAILINRMKWKGLALQYERYEILPEKVVTEGDYLSSELIIYYENDSILDLKISISNVENVMPDIKISSYITDFN